MIYMTHIIIKEFVNFIFHLQKSSFMGCYRYIIRARVLIIKIIPICNFTIISIKNITKFCNLQI